MSRSGAKCPAGDTLSAFVDGELQAPWEQAIARHAETCPACRQRVVRFQRLRERLANDVAPAPRLSPPWQQPPRPKPVPFWKRRIALPLPAAAAAGLAILALGVALTVVAGRADLPWMRIRHAPTGAMEVIVAAPIKDLEQLLRNLDQPPQSTGLVIQLPANSPLIMVGEPQLVREADYSRGRKW
jgi:anti-sigma factor RsiW